MGGDSPSGGDDGSGRAGACPVRAPGAPRAGDAGPAPAAEPRATGAHGARPPAPVAPGATPDPGRPRPDLASAPGAGLALLIEAQPLPLLLVAICGLAMLVPAAHAAGTGYPALAQAFFAAAGLVLLAALLVGLALNGRRRPASLRAQLATLVGGYLALPLVLAIPFLMARPGTGLVAAWFEMISALTTTGATLFADPAALPPSLHLWRALVGWLGGLFIWVMAAAVFRPLNLGGFEVMGGSPGSALPAGSGEPGRSNIPAARVARTAAELAPVWFGLTLALWLGLVLAGDGALVALCHAMSTLSTSGISPLVGGVAGSASGRAGELLILLFLVFALSRRSFAAAGRGGGLGQSLADPELRLGLAIVFGVAGLLFLRHWLGAIGDQAPQDALAGLRNFWGTLFSAASFLSTTGFVSADWISAPYWSGLAAPGVILMGLAVFGGGVATTAGGVKLLRVLALWRHGRRELEKLVDPLSVGGGGPEARQMRRQGAEVAWVFFMLFALSCGAVMLALTLTGLELREAIVFAVAALSTTGQLAQVAGESPLLYSDLDAPARIILGVAMVLGRVETLAVIALLNPGLWRR